jgi:hypothetical protein
MVLANLLNRLDQKHRQLALGIDHVRKSLHNHITSASGFSQRKRIKTDRETPIKSSQKQDDRASRDRRHCAPNSVVVVVMGEHRDASGSSRVQGTPSGMGRKVPAMSPTRDAERDTSSRRPKTRGHRNPRAIQPSHVCAWHSTTPTTKDAAAESSRPNPTREPVTPDTLAPASSSHALGIAIEEK